MGGRWTRGEGYYTHILIGATPPKQKQFEPIACPGDLSLIICSRAFLNEEKETSRPHFLKAKKHNLEPRHRRRRRSRKRSTCIILGQKCQKTCFWTILVWCTWFLSKSRNHPGKLRSAELDLGWAQGRTFHSKKKRSHPIRNVKAVVGCLNNSRYIIKKKGKH